MILKTKNLNLFYGSTKAINNCNVNIEKNKVLQLLVHLDVENLLYYDL